ncbi:ubiquitin-specific protease ubp2, partial [Ceratobasidium sp. 423]
MTQIDPSSTTTTHPDAAQSEARKPTEGEPTAAIAKSTDSAPAQEPKADGTSPPADPKSNPEYRPPELVPNSTPKVTFDPMTGGVWQDQTTGDISWGQDQAGNWDTATNNANEWNGSGWKPEPGTFGASAWGPREPNPADWGMPTNELERWWDPQLHQKKPGPGMLAPRVIEMIHDSNHVLYEVTISGNPTTEPQPASALSPKPSVFAAGVLNSATASPVPSSSPAPPPSAGETTPAPEPVVPHTLPTSEELRDATPHPAALYCRKHHGW